MATNVLQKIEGYMAGTAFPQLMLDLNILNIADTKYDNWKIAQNLGVRGGSVSFSLPVPFVVQKTLGIPNSAPQNYLERRTALSITNEVSVPISISDFDLATYGPDMGGGLAQNMSGAVTSIATSVCADVTQTTAVTSNRFLGNSESMTLGPGANGEIHTNFNASFGEIVKAYRQFRNYGSAPQVDCVLPSIVTASIADTGFQQFANKRNNKMGTNWQIEGLGDSFGNINFYSSDLLEVVDTGTAAKAQAAPYVIQSVDNTAEYPLPGTATVEKASIITIAVPADGLTVIPGDKMDIIPFSSTEPAIKLTQAYVKKPSYTNPQARVVEAATSASNLLTLKVVPRLQISTPADALDNISRPIRTYATNPGTADGVRLLKPRLPGFMLNAGYLKFAAPALENTFPFKSTRKSMSGVGMRMYQGHEVTQASKFWAHDMIYGFLPVAEGIAEIPFSPKMAAGY